MTTLKTPEWLEPRKYQEEAVAAWMNNQGQGILNMATGTGKTITALIAASRLSKLQNDELALIVAAPYQHLVDQWVDEMENFGMEPIRAYQSRNTWLDELTAMVTEFQTGTRDILAVVTTHNTFSRDHFQQITQRFNGSKTLLIVDEVHHMGAPHLRESLNPRLRARLGLSATPRRWYDDEGTEALLEYFSQGIVFEYNLEDAIENGHLTDYYYIPHIIHLTDTEAEDYLALSKAIGRRASNASGDLGDASFQNDEKLKQLLFKRARLIGSAENKVEKLSSLIEEMGPSKVHHTLIYSGDGQVGEEGDETKRQLRAVTELLGNKFGIKTHQFTYEENQETRERLLGDFEENEIEALVAIRCLDEGVDVPATETAFILASSTNPRQFIQRRGRILRTHPGKDNAIIHDFIVAPPEEIRLQSTGNSEFDLERNLVRKELKRVSMFADNAKNHPDASLASIPTSSESIGELKKDFNLLDV